MFHYFYEHPANHFASIVSGFSCLSFFFQISLQRDNLRARFFGSPRWKFLKSSILFSTTPIRFYCGGFHYFLIYRSLFLSRIIYIDYIFLTKKKIRFFLGIKFKIRINWFSMPQTGRKMLENATKIVKREKLCFFFLQARYERAEAQNSDEYLVINESFSAKKKNRVWRKKRKSPTSSM